MFPLFSFITSKESTLKNMKNTFYFIEKAFFYSRDIQFFVLSSTRPASPLSAIAEFTVDADWRSWEIKEGMILKFGQLVKYYIRKIFAVSYTEDLPQKLVPDLYSVLINSPKYSQCIQETLFVSKMFRTRIIKNPLKEPGTDCQFLFRLPNMFTSFLSLVINHLPYFDAFIHRGFWDIQKIMIESFSKPFYDIIIPFSASS